MDLAIYDSATQFDSSVRGRVVVCGSHGGLYAAWLAAAAGVRGVILNDAGIGRHSAGVAGVAWLGGRGIAACAIDYRSARIGDGADMIASGIVSTVNELAASQGCLPGQGCREAAACLVEHAEPAAGEAPAIGESRTRVATTGHRPIWALDSVALAQPGDARSIVVTGSHGGLLGGLDPDGVLEVDVFAAFFNDAGGGKDGAGYSRLAALERREVAAATVYCHSARIGDGRSTYETGVLSRVNEIARHLELHEGMSARSAIARLVGLG